MKQWFNKNWVIIGAFFVLLIPFLALLTALLFFKINIFDNPDFWYGYMAYFGSVILASVAMHQTQKSNKLSEKFDKMNALQNYSFVKATNQCELAISHHDDLTVTLSAHHKKDSGAIILLERRDISSLEFFNEYLFELQFKDFSKAAIKSFEINEKQMVCVQEPAKAGMQWSSGGTDPIPIGFVKSSSITNAYPIWIGDDVFKINLKIYAVMGGVFANMIENSVPFCLMMQVKLHSVCGVQTLMKFKYWFIKDKEKIKIDSNESLLIDISQEEITDAH